MLGCTPGSTPGRLEVRCEITTQTLCHNFPFDGKAAGVVGQVSDLPFSGPNDCRKRRLAWGTTGRSLNRESSGLTPAAV
jgi:hypothetical protein